MHLDIDSKQPTSHVDERAASIPTHAGQGMPIESSRRTPSRLLDEREAAALLNVSVGLLRKWRRLGTGVPPVKLGRLIRYQPASIQAYIDACSAERDK